ncbi:response regulator [Candidatus Woesearchaeota archaeon]|nr:response regulator [Candidatus Woesearchaeota archaeon]
METQKKNLKVLLAEDYDSTRMIYGMHLKRYLSEAGFQVEMDIAEDGKEALDFTRSNKYGLIVSDYDMPRLTGAQMYLQLKPEHQSRTVLMSSTPAQLKHDLRAGGVENLPLIHDKQQALENLDQKIAQCLQIN